MSILGCRLDLFAYKHNYGTNDVTAEVPFQVTAWGEEGVVGEASVQSNGQCLVNK